MRITPRHAQQRQSPWTSDKSLYTVEYTVLVVPSASLLGQALGAGVVSGHEP